MHTFCPFCKNPLAPWYQWKASNGRSYCNEFCADAADTDWALTSQLPEFRDSPSNAHR